MQCGRIRDEALAAEKMEVLYGEADPEVRGRVEDHLRDCAACRDEMRALRRLRRSLGAWTLEGTRQRAAGAPRIGLPAWLVAAAAAALALGIGLSIQSQVSLRRELRAQESRAQERERVHQQETAALRAELRSTRAALDAEALLARVDERLESRMRRSDEDQTQRLSAAFSEWNARMEAQRRVDLARVAAGLSYLDGRHGQQLARTNELMGYVLEAATDQRSPR